MSPLAPPPQTVLQALMKHPSWNPLRRVLGLRPNFEIWSDASKDGYGFHLGPKDKVLDAWHLPRAGRVPPNFFSPRPLSAPTNPPKMVPLPNGPDDNVGTPPGYLSNLDADVNVAKDGPTDTQLNKFEASTELHEAIAMYLALDRWVALVRGGRVTCYTDNHAVAMALETGPKPSKYHSKVIFAIQDLAEQNGVKLKAKWVPRTQNNLADRLSRMRKEHPEFSAAVTGMLARAGDAGEKVALRKLWAKLLEESALKPKQKGKEKEKQEGLREVAAIAEPPIVEQVVTA